MLVLPTTILLVKYVSVYRHAPVFNIKVQIFINLKLIVLNFFKHVILLGLSDNEELFESVILRYLLRAFSLNSERLYTVGSVYKGMCF